MPIELTVDEQLMVLRRRIELLRMQYADNVLSISLFYQQADLSDQDRQTVEQLKAVNAQIEVNVVFMEKEIAALGEAV